MLRNPAIEFLNAVAAIAFLDALLLQLPVQFLVELGQRMAERAIERLDDDQPLVALEAKLLDRLAERPAEADRMKRILAIAQPWNFEHRREALRQRTELLIGGIADARRKAVQQHVFFHLVVVDQ